ncbi:DUF6895 family protein [Nonomuraea sp. N2-4H]|uniref:DUF6895 family protein n=1 Tax=Nonomuraea sp. N2-4H TaxID=3128898 RepID=UPI0038737F6E
MLPCSDQSARADYAAPSRRAVEDKVLTEAAILLHVTQKVLAADASVAPCLEQSHKRLLKTLAARAYPERYFDMLARAPHIAWPLGITHAILSRHAVVNPSFEKLLERCIDLGWNGFVDRSIYRTLETRWALAVYKNHHPEVADLLALAPTNDTLPAPLALRESVYALTHTLFYASDFGAYPMPDSVKLDRTAECIDSFLAWQMWEGDLDLVGELLAAAYMCRLPSKYASIAIAVLWDDFCRPVVRGPYAKISHKGAVSPFDPTIFSSCYHTTFVCGILCAAILASGRPMESDRISNGEVRSLTRSEVQPLFDILEQSGRPTVTWFSRIAAVRDSRMTILSCLFDGAVTIAYRTGNWRSVYALRNYREAMSIGATRTWRSIAELCNLWKDFGEDSS